MRFHLAAVPLVVTATLGLVLPGPAHVPPASAAGARAACAPTDTVEVAPGAGAAYYEVALRPPASSLGGREPAGRVEVSYPPSAFGLPLDREGTLVHRLRVVLEERWRSGRGRLVAWVAPPDLDPVRRLGEIGPDGTVSGQVAMNKYLVFVTEEPPGAGDGSRWQGPVVLKGKSRSGRMQSMASHGMFEPEPC